MLDTLTLEDFAPHLETEFLCRIQENGTLTLKLTEATGLGSPVQKVRESPSAPARRQGFSLIFVGPPEPILPQAIWPLEHPAFGTLEIFIVPIARVSEGIEYQAIFN